jgi:hypothetical protein
MMRFFDWLFGRADATKQWRGLPGASIDVDFSRHSLGGVAIGEPIGGLEPAGPAERCDRGRGENYYRYHSKGFEFAEHEGRAVFYGFTFLDEYGDGFNSFQGRCMWAGRDLNFCASTRESEIIAALGQPYWRDEDDNEIILFYEFPSKSIEWQFELSKDGTLQFLLMTTPPLLAESRVREAFGVTKPWPPMPAVAS